MIAWQYHPYMLPFFVSGLVVVALFFVGWRRRHMSEAGVFLLLIIVFCMFSFPAHKDNLLCKTITRS